MAGLKPLVCVSAAVLGALALACANVSDQESPGTEIPGRLSVTAIPSNETTPSRTPAEGEASVSTFVGDISQGSVGAPGYIDGPPGKARFGELASVASAPGGALYVADPMNNVIRKVDRNGEVSTFAGTGEEGDKDGQAAEASFRGPTDVAIDQSGNVYVADTLNHKIRKIDTTGQVTTVAGGGEIGLGGGGYQDGPVSEARFRLPKGVAVTLQGALLIADTDNHRVRRIEGGMVSTVAGNGKIGSGDGPAATATFGALAGITVAPSGDVYIIDQSRSSIRRLSAAGEVSTLAAGGELKHPFDLVLVPGDQIVVANTAGHNLIQVGASDGVVSILAGGTTPGFQDGAASSARFFNPSGVALGEDGRVLVADGTNGLIRRLENWP